ncbi:MAG TPA: FtsX-like permease family protein [Euryarchaeota archaeon]|nr:putative ABC transporter permease YknZ [archaeon BMS3Bbin15]HDL15855.1 FtsX-like permease family protein [Euryarchaeota archaeon]
MSLKSILGAIGSFFKVVEVVFLAIGSIALIVAGFGIMNTMLMSVLERTREIGVLKSIGARRIHIIQIFLAESALIGLFGGILGIIFGIIGSAGMNIIAKFALASLTKMPAEKVAELPAITQIPLWLILFALCFSVIISIAFGLYPAIKASKLSPVEALRYQ